MGKKIFLFTQYNVPDNGRSIASPIAGITYVDYIKKCIKSLGNSISVVSVSGGLGKSYFTKKIINVDSKETLVFLPTLNQQGSSFRLRISELFIYFQVFLFLLTKTRTGDIIVVYHDYGLSFCFYYLRKIFPKRQYITIVAELFSAVALKPLSDINHEMGLFKGVNNYIFINNILPKYFGKNIKYAVAHGNYESINCRRGDKSQKDINVVYAGKIDSKEITDAFLAVESSRFLCENYHVFILGYGKKNDIELLLDLINKVNSEVGFDVVSYEGCLTGKEYDDFLNRCQIGLCTRAMPEPYCNFCFPSKTIVYLTHGLRVICPQSSNIVTSNVSSFIDYIEGDVNAENVAKAVMKSGINTKNDISENLFRIDQGFKSDLRVILN